MRSKTGWVAGVGAAAVVAAAVITGCSPQLKDQGSVAQANPDYIVTYLNVDTFPNITLICIEGVGFATTSRDYSALTPEPKWDAFCATQMPSSPHVIPGTGTTHPVSGH